MRVGDWMIAIGNPFGLGSTVTAGIISARGRDIHAGPYDDFLQVDAPINRGNSGGPSFNLERRGDRHQHRDLLADRAAIVGIGFAIPSNLAKPVIDSSDATGKVARGWLGVRIQTVTDEIAESLGLPQTARCAGRRASRPAARPRRPDPGRRRDPGVRRQEHRPHARLPRLVAETPIGEDGRVSFGARASR